MTFPFVFKRKEEGGRWGQVTWETKTSLDGKKTESLKVDDRKIGSVLLRPPNLVYEWKKFIDDFTK